VPVFEEFILDFVWPFLLKAARHLNVETTEYMNE